MTQDGVLTGLSLGSKARVVASVGEDVSTEIPFKVKGDEVVIQAESSGSDVPSVFTGAADHFNIVTSDFADVVSCESSDENLITVSVADAGITVNVVAASDSVGKAVTITISLAGGATQTIEIVIGHETPLLGIAAKNNGQTITGATMILGDATYNAAHALDLSYVTEPSDATYGNATWSSANPEVARVDAASGVVTAVGTGTATIKVTSVKYPEISAPVEVTVRNPIIAVHAWDGSKWAKIKEVSAAWGSALSEALSSESAANVTLTVGDDSVPYVFEGWSVAVPEANSDPSSYEPAGLTQQDVLDSDGKAVYATYNLESYEVSFKKWNPNKEGGAGCDDYDPGNSQTYEWGQEYVAPTQPEPGMIGTFFFSGWGAFDVAPESYETAALTDDNAYSVREENSIAVKSAVTLYSCYEDQALPGVFSLGVEGNKTKKVRFSRGGLTNDCIYDGDHNPIGRTWRFMPKQYQYDYDYGTRGCNLLTWSCEKTQFGTTNSPSLEDDDSFVDWGHGFRRRLRMGVADS